MDDRAGASKANAPYRVSLSKSTSVTDFRRSGTQSGGGSTSRTVHRSKIHFARSLISRRVEEEFPKNFPGESHQSTHSYDVSFSERLRRRVAGRKSQTKIPASGRGRNNFSSTRGKGEQHRIPKLPLNAFRYALYRATERGSGQKKVVRSRRVQTEPVNTTPAR